MGFNTPPRADVDFLTSNICAFNQSYRFETGQISWYAPRDATKFMLRLNLHYFYTCNILFHITNSQFLTIDDDFIGTRSKYNQVKALSARKADREGQSEEVRADGIFRTTLEARLRRRGETKIIDVGKIMDSLIEDRRWK